MKKILCLLYVIPALVFAQSSYTVSNVPGANANFKTLQGAHDSVAAGSILYLSPSSYSYGNAVFTKKLTVYGTGYFLGQNLDPYTQANPGSVLVNSITFRAGSDNSFVEGLQMAFQADEQGNRFNIDTVSSIIISRCLIVSPIYGAYGGYHNLFSLAGANNCLIKQCYLQNTNGYVIPPIITYTGDHPNFSGIQFVNNVFDWQAIGSFRVGPYGNEGLTGGTADVSFINNTFIIPIKDATYGNSSFTNNIFVNSVPTNVPTATANMIGTTMNNIAGAVIMFPNPASNAQGINTDSMFTGGLAGYHSIDQKWMLRDTSFANSFGQGGVAVGAYGGSNTYKLSGISSIPYIYNLNVPAQATAPGTIGVRIKARATN